MSSESLSIGLDASLDMVEFPSHLLIDRKDENVEGPGRFLDAMAQRLSGRVLTRRQSSRFANTELEIKHSVETLSAASNNILCLV
jgi:hypothetical protein